MRDMDLRQIEIFIAVARQQNISRAAQDLYISQPAISNWIAKMEADCGEKLFYRTNRGVSLTPKGEEMYARLDIVYNRFRVSVAEICGDPSTPKCRPSHRLPQPAAAGTGGKSNRAGLAGALPGKAGV